jgi:hypothetical protein
MVNDMNKVSILPIITTQSYDPDTLLEAAKEKLSSVIIIGYDKDGEEFFSSSVSDGADVVWLLEMTKLNLLSISKEL